MRRARAFRCRIIYNLVIIYNLAIGCWISLGGDDLEGLSRNSSRPERQHERALRELERFQAQSERELVRQQVERE